MLLYKRIYDLINLSTVLFEYIYVPWEHPGGRIGASVFFSKKKYSWKNASILIQMDRNSQIYTTAVTL